MGEDAKRQSSEPDHESDWTQHNVHSISPFPAPSLSCYLKHTGYHACTYTLLDGLPISERGMVFERRGVIEVSLMCFLASGGFGRR
jgi:hypothetical protein